MQFNQKALDQKMKHLDEIKQYPEYVERVVFRNLGTGYEVEELQRRWVGGVELLI